MPRGRSLGMVMQLQDSDQTSQSRKQVIFISAHFVNWFTIMLLSKMLKKRKKGHNEREDRLPPILNADEKIIREIEIEEIKRERT